jgi:hypothetical protein
LIVEDEEGVLLSEAECGPQEFKFPFKIASRNRPSSPFDSYDDDYEPPNLETDERDEDEQKGFDDEEVEENL